MLEIPSLDHPVTKQLQKHDVLAVAPVHREGISDEFVACCCCNSPAATQVGLIVKAWAAPVLQESLKIEVDQLSLSLVSSISYPLLLGFYPTPQARFRRD